ncbi:YdbT family protein [Rhodohalobacter halophilus]|uniref:PH domain-containing protein n=1 Tax=Rhodohalobacter halophilus TaxID=1812810 RepID=UPI00083F5C71|nr:PH domain-containing protein [Rhodohalobacter halophilus]
MSDTKSISLKPSHKSLFWWYLLGVLLIPLFGAGLYLIWRFYSAHSSITYIVKDKTITFSDSKVEQNVDIINIDRVDVKQRWIDQKFDIGNLYVITDTDSASIEMLGIEQPHRLAQMIESAAETERKRIAELKKKKPQKKEISKPGRDDRMDYLTGLWQQGLISEEDFERERKHFE